MYHKYAILQIDSSASKGEQFLFTKKMSSKIFNQTFQTVICNDTEFLIVNIPFCIKNINKEKNIKRFSVSLVQILQNIGIKMIFMSKSVKNIPILERSILQSFEICTGKKVIQYFQKKIVKKYLANQTDNMQQYHIVIIADKVEQTHQFIEEICQNVQTIEIVAEREDDFINLTENIFFEYGFMVPCRSRITPFIEKGKLYINLSGNTDFIMEEINKNGLEILDISKEHQTNKYFYQQFIFYLKDVFYPVVKYLQPFDQCSLEYLVRVLYNNFNEKVLDEFVKEYNVRVLKIKKND